MPIPSYRSPAALLGALALVAAVAASPTPSHASADSQIVDLDGSACASLDTVECVAEQRDRHDFPFAVGIHTNALLDSSSVRVRPLGSSGSWTTLDSSSADVPAGDVVLWQMTPEAIGQAISGTSMKELEENGIEVRIRIVSKELGGQNCASNKYRMRGLSFPRVWQVYDLKAKGWYDLPSQGLAYTSLHIGGYLERDGFFCH